MSRISRNLRCMSRTRYSDPVENLILIIGYVIHHFSFPQCQENTKHHTHIFDSFSCILYTVTDVLRMPGYLLNRWYFDRHTTPAELKKRGTISLYCNSILRCRFLLYFEHLCEPEVANLIILEWPVYVGCVSLVRTFQSSVVYLTCG